MSDLPTGWTETTIGEINTYKSKSLNPLNFGKETFELYSVPSFPQDTPEILQGSEIGSSKQVVQPEDVLICKINPRINRVWKVKPSGKHKQIASSEWIVVRAPAFHSGYLKHYFSSPLIRERIVMDVTGVGGSLTRAQPKRVAKFPVLVAPLDEQKRIAEKLDSLLTRVDSCERHLERVPQILKRFRQSVLAAATSGRLTEEWREENAVIGNWRLVNLREVATGFNYGTSAKSQKEGKVPVLRMGNIQDGKLDWSDLVFTSSKDEIEKYKLVKGDVLFNRTNSPDLVGKTAVYKGERPAIYAGYLIKVKCGDELLPDFINYCLNSPMGRDWRWQVKSDGVSQSNINAQKLADFEFELPSLEEQAEIVRRVERLFAYAERLEARYLSASERVERLTPSLLGKGFRGELVEQEKEEE